MFKKSRRVKRQLFPIILKKGKVYHSENFTLRIIEPHTKDVGKISFVVSKKVEQSSVKRNQLRRRCYHAVKDLFNKPFPFTGVFFVKKGVISLTFSEMKMELERLFKSVQERN